MFDIFGNVKSLLKIQSVCIDNAVFRLHYQVTVIILIIFSVLVGSRQYFGDPIDCTSNADTQHVIDNYCWIHSYIELIEKKELRSSNIENDNPTTTKINQRYYQWVGFVLFFQSMLFYIPRYLWKYCWEEGKIKALASGMKGQLVEREKEKERKKLISEYFDRNVGKHNFYYFKYIFCEILNLCNVIAQIIFMNEFLDFTNFAANFLNLHFLNLKNVNQSYNSPRKDLLSTIYFPKVANCDFTYLSHGGETTFKSLCVLPVNIFNEKIYAFLWVWFVILFLLTSVTLVYRAFTFFPCVRAFLLRQTVSFDPNIRNTIDNITKSYSVGDWFLLFQIGKNAHSFVFAQVLENFKISPSGDNLDEQDKLLANEEVRTNEV